MLKKLFVTAAAAAALSVPLAGVAWADAPTDPNNPPGHPASTDTKPGIPGEAGSFADAVGINPKPGQPLPPGQFFKNIAKMPGSTPVAAKGVVENLYNTIPDIPGAPVTGTVVLDAPVPPGMATKTFTPACTSGHTVLNDNVNGGNPVATEKPGSCAVHIPCLGCGWCHATNVR